MAVEITETEARAPATKDIPAGKDVRRVYAEMLAISMTILFIAIVVTWRIGQDSNQLYHKLFHAKMGLDELKQNVQAREARLGGAR